MVIKAKKFVLSKHFINEPKSSDMTLVEEELPPIKDGEILIEAEYFSLDAGLRAYSARFPLGITMCGTQVAKIIESKNLNWPVGERILGDFGWRTHTIINPNNNNEMGIVYKKPRMIPDFGDLPTSLALGVLGMSGNTAYFGFLEICNPKAGETVVVSGAAGAVGSHVGQIAKIKGLNVIGIAGTDKKCEWLINELGFHHAINYKKENITEALKKAAPNGIDCYFDNVGGEISSAVIYHMNNFGRISVCGSVSSYNDENPLLAKSTILQPALVMKQLKMEGFIVMRWNDQWDKGIQENLKWINEGKLIYKETITKGFENILNAFIGMLKGDNFGKTIVQV